MKTKIQIENTDYPYCVIHTKEMKSALKDLQNHIEKLDDNGKEALLPLWDKDFCLYTPKNEIIRIYSEDKKVLVKTTKENALNLKLRLYQVEELNWNEFVRVSNTDIVNVAYIQKFDLSLTGVIRIILKDNSSVTVSRRYMKDVKERIKNIRGEK